MIKKIPFLLVVIFSTTSYICIITAALSYLRAIGEADPVALGERRFAAIKRDLPKTGVVGYVTDISSDRVLSDTDTSAEYYIAQYTLSPLILDNSADHPIVIGNFRKGLVLLSGEKR